uniref:Transferase family protein n=1 Tax=Oryza rufipogon TaxID=4529 RepID=A0A0E0RDF8_ORYRU
MEVQVKRSSVVPPPPRETEETPLTVFELVAPTYHVTVLFAFSPPNPTTRALLDALSATLPHFPLLTARLDRRGARRRPFFVTGRGGAGALVVEAEVGGAGALVVEAEVSSELADHLPLAPSPELARLHPPVNTDAPTPHVLLVQINRFACGGLVVASSAHHQAADGFSMSTFFHAWTDAIRRNGAPLLDRPVPYGPGALSPRRPPRCEFEHRGKEFLPHDGVTSRQGQGADTGAVRIDPSEVANVLLHYPSEFVAELKRRAQGKYTTFETVSAHLKRRAQGKYTTFETVSAHVWKKITTVRGLDAGARTSVNVSVNGRARLGTGTVPNGFFGNLIINASSGATARELTTGTLADAAALIRAGIRAVDRRYFQSFIDFGALHVDGGRDEEEPLQPANVDEPGVLSPDVDSDSWLHLELHRLDMGLGGRLAGILPAKVPEDGVVVVMPSLRKSGGVEVFVALWEKHANELTSIAYTMD